MDEPVFNYKFDKIRNHDNSVINECQIKSRKDDKKCETAEEIEELQNK